MRYFKVMRGFGQDDFISIDETELEKAALAHATGRTVILNNGSINGMHISAILPDYHKAMGWNYGYKITSEDWNDINRKLSISYNNFLAPFKEKLESLKIKENINNNLLTS